jgi:hypothetical protein
VEAATDGSGWVYLVGLHDALVSLACGLIWWRRLKPFMQALGWGFPVERFAWAAEAGTVGGARLLRDPA